MKNILARGGIEFLAVLLGISASLWIDNNNKEAELESQRQETYRLLENQTEELINYTNDRIEYYELQAKRFGIIIDQWETIDFDTIKNQEEYRIAIWGAFTNAFRPDFSTYETLINGGQINLIDLETINSFGRLYKFMDHINSVQRSESEWRDLMGKHFSIEYAESSINNSYHTDFFFYLDMTRKDPLVISHLKQIKALQNYRKNHVNRFKGDLIKIQNHLAEVQNEN